MTRIGPDELLTPRDLLTRHFGSPVPAPGMSGRYRELETDMFLRSPVFAMNNYMYVESPDRQLVLMSPYPGQAQLDVAVESQRRRGLPQRVIEAKPRQVGFTARNIGRALWTVMHLNMHADILVDDLDVAEDAARRLGTMMNNLPMWLQPKRRISNLTQIILDNPNPKERLVDPGLNSSIQVTIPSPKRGRTPQLAIICEYSFMSLDRQMLVMEGLVNAMPLNVHSCVIIDTTPNGHDDMYEPALLEACDVNEKWVKRWYTLTKPPTALEIYQGILGEPDHPGEGWVPVFTPWYWHPTYTTKDEHPLGELPKMTREQRADITDTLGKVSRYGNDEELFLHKKFGVPIERLRWRRFKIDTAKQPSERLRVLSFHQEYASDHLSMFVDYGKSAFDPECVEVLMRGQRDPSARGVLRDDGKRIVLDTTFHSDYEELRVYAGPEADELYVMGVDTGTAYQSPEADSTVAQILRFRDMKLVTTYVAKTSTQRLHEQLYMLYRWYNNAFYAIETEGVGYDLMRTLYDRGARNVYYWRRLDAEFPEPTKYLGWDTGPRTRPIMERALCALIDRRDKDGKPDPAIIIPDAQTLRQLQGVRRSPDGRIKATGSAHDDCVDALMIAVAIAEDPWGGLHVKKERRERREQLAYSRMEEVYGEDNHKHDLAYM